MSLTFQIGIINMATCSLLCDTALLLNARHA
jgi:hypothetical protein